MRLRSGERLFVLWGGLKGAVPILLAAFAVAAHVAARAANLRDVFVVVLASVVVQGGTIAFAAERFRRADATGRPYATRRTVCVRPVARTRSYRVDDPHPAGSRTSGSQTAHTVWSRRRPRQMR